MSSFQPLSSSSATAVSAVVTTKEGEDTVEDVVMNNSNSTSTGSSSKGLLTEKRLSSSSILPLSPNHLGHHNKLQKMDDGGYISSRTSLVTSSSSSSLSIPQLPPPSSSSSSSSSLPPAAAAVAASEVTPPSSSSTSRDATTDAFDDTKAFNSLAKKHGFTIISRTEIPTECIIRIKLRCRNDNDDDDDVDGNNDSNKKCSGRINYPRSFYLDKQYGDSDTCKSGGRGGGYSKSGNSKSNSISVSSGDDDDDGDDWRKSKGKKVSYRVWTDDDFLQDNLFAENLLEVVAGACSVQVVMKAVREVYNCITGDGGEDNNSDGDGGGWGDGDEDHDNDGDVKYAYADDDELAMEHGGGGVGGGGSDSAVTDNFHTEGETVAAIPAVAAAAKAGKANQRLLRDLGRMMRTDTASMGFSLEPKQEDCMNVWKVQLFGFSGCELSKDLEKLKKEKGQGFIELELKYPDDYPYSPPFVRIVYPRIQKSTGYVIDGAFCFELLTKQGWTPTNDIESVLVQLRAQLIVGKARIDFSASQPYDELKAIHAFKSAAAYHKWKI